jgi:hypothetical protein
VTDRLHRRQLLRYVLLGGGVVLVGSALARRGSPIIDLPQQRTPHGDVLETVPPGEGCDRSIPKSHVA